MKYESMRMSTFVFFVSIVLWQFHVPLGAQRTPSAFEIHQRFQVESGFHFVSGNQSSLFFQPSEDFPEEVVPTDSSGYSVLDTWSDDKINSPQVRHIRELLKVGKGGEALPLLLELTRLYPEVTPYRLWLAEAYFLEWNHFKANEILDYLLKHYPLYSFPYQIKAEIHLRKKEYEEALEWAAKARVLQAAHPKIIGTFESVASRGGYKMTVKLLRPNYRITKEANRFVVTSDPLWETYAMCKCLWDYSEGYARERGGSPGKRFDMHREQECFLAMYSQIKSNPEFIKFPESKLLIESVEKKKLQEFIMMEIFLPLQPALAFSMSKSQKNELEWYLTHLRVQP